ncbi:hypothetical protein G7Z17_g3229 [Cylindrodendrum hubeiense]|uniref:Uncharacterized protein n=1 Tax=Cylindrodendrum hubeiense TaxID=595255 RepID=A0A9P5HLN1_9HYPO|nr:hypothetical protein G7Z17_g3229 [Cylindrodendrum hubeiense]
MSPTLVTRVAVQAARHASFSTAAPLLKPMATTSTRVTSSGLSKWRWSNLSPQARRNVVVGATVSGCVDAYVFYNYWPQIFGSK